MQRASPTMMRPVRNSGRSGRNNQARVNMKAGPITQLRIRDSPIGRRSAGDGADASVADLGQDRVHHGQQADGDRQRDGADLDLVEPVVEVREGTTEEQTADHRQSDPQWQQPVQGRQASSDVPVNRGEGRGHRSAAVDVTVGLTWLPTACASSQCGEIEGVFDPSTELASVDQLHVA